MCFAAVSGLAETACCRSGGMHAQDDTLEPQPGSRLGAVVDDRGALVERQTLVMAERTLLCEVR